MATRFDRVIELAKEELFEQVYIDYIRDLKASHDALLRALKALSCGDERYTENAIRAAEELSK